MYPRETPNNLCGNLAANPRLVVTINLTGVFLRMRSAKPRPHPSLIDRHSIKAGKFCKCLDLMRTKMNSFMCFSLLQLFFLEGAIATVEWSIRLQGGATPLEGYAEVLLGGEWGVIGSNQWDIRDAMVVCRQLGFPTAKNATLKSDINPIQLATSIHIDNVECSGAERVISNCSYRSVGTQRVRQHGKYAGVICAGDHSLRLINKSSPNSGVLQVYLNGNHWASVCHDSSIWTRKDAEVACRQLGYEQLLSSTGVSSIGEDVATVAPNCTGDEFNLQSCFGYSITSQSCSTNLRVRLQCRGAPSVPNPPRVSHVTCSSVMVSWNTSLDNGGPMVHYIVRYRPIESIITDLEYIPWCQQNTSDVRTLINDLLPGAIYLVGVEAHNDIGSSASSESTLFITQSPEILPPLDLLAVSTGSTSINISWMVPPSCGIKYSSYELQYHSLADSGSKLTDTVPITNHMAGLESFTVSHTLQHLKPYSRYIIRVRTYGNDRLSQLVVSNYSDPVSVWTDEDVPSVSPTTFTAFLRSSAHFEWGPIPESQSNGVITHYHLSCRYYLNRTIGQDVSGCTFVDDIQEMKWSVSNSTFQYELNVERNACYECKISASTQAGEGLSSAPIIFSTPADLNVRPNPPQNVAFAIIPHNDNTRQQEIRLQARWAIQDCEGDFACIKVLGYIIECTTDRIEDEIRKIVLTSQITRTTDSMTSIEFLVRPFTRYQCSIGSMNSYRLGLSGSRVSIQTYELVPLQSPTQIYTTNVQPMSVRLHWTYNESPPTGILVAFYIYIYERNLDNPDQIGPSNLYHTEIYEVRSSIIQINFDHELYLVPGTDYIAVISAATSRGIGPGARMSLSTPRSFPQAPDNFEYSVVSKIGPFQYHFTWTISQSYTRTGRSMVHTGFTIYCGTNQTVANFKATGKNIIKQSVFTDRVEQMYRADVFLPVNCDAMIHYYMCSVAAFNEKGEGPMSRQLKTYLPCDFTSDPLENSFLGHPYFGLTFFSISLLLVLCFLICSLLVCICYKRNKYREEEKIYAAVNEIYDESYIHMAPSDPSIKPSWSRNHSISHRVVPPVPSNRSSFDVRANLEAISTNYDEIRDGGRQVTDPQQLHNLYAEINPRTGSGAVSGGTQDGSERNSTSLFRTGSRRSRNGSNNLALRNINNPPQNLDESQVTTTTNNSRLELTLTNDTTTTGINDNSLCTDLLRPSLSNNTSLSGNDYVEITANGELRPMTKRANVSCSPSKSSASLKYLVDAFPVDCHLKSNPYDNIPDVKTIWGNPCLTDTCESDEKSKKAYEMGCQHSEFVRFVDDMAERSESKGLIDSNDPAYVAMSNCDFSESDTESAVTVKPDDLLTNKNAE